MGNSHVGIRSHSRVTLKEKRNVSSKTSAASLSLHITILNVPGQKYLGYGCET